MWSPDAYIPNCEPKDPKDKNNPFASIDSLNEQKWQDGLREIMGKKGKGGELNRLLAKKGHNGIFMAMMFIMLVVLPFFGDYQQDYHQLKAAKQEQANQSSVTFMNNLTNEVTKSRNRNEMDADSAIKSANEIIDQLRKGWKKATHFWKSPTEDPDGFAAGILTQLGHLMNIPDLTTKVSTNLNYKIPMSHDIDLKGYWEGLWAPPQPGTNPKPGTAPQELISAETAIQSALNGFSAKMQTQLKYYGAQNDQFIKEMHDLMSSLINCIKKSNQQSQGT